MENTSKPSEALFPNPFFSKEDTFIFVWISQIIYAARTIIYGKIYLRNLTKHQLANLAYASQEKTSFKPLDRDQIQQGIFLGGSGAILEQKKECTSELNFFWLTV